MISITCDNCDKSISKGEKYIVLPDVPVMCGPVKLANDCVLCEACYKKHLKKCGQLDAEIPEDRQIVLEEDEVKFLKDVLQIVMDKKSELHSSLSQKGADFASAIMEKLTK